MEELMYIFTHVDIFLIVFCRIICAIVLLPIIEEANVNVYVKAGLGVFLSLITVMTLDVNQIIYNKTTIGYTSLLIQECMVGLILGFGMKIFFQVYHFVGSVLSMQGGISMSTTLDPTAGSQVTIVGRFYSLCYGVVFLLSGGYHWFIKNLIESYQTIPIGKAVFTPYIVQSFITGVNNYFIISLKLSLPILGVILLVDLGLGILARAVPQMNMFVVGIPIKIILLFVLMLMTLSLFAIFNKMITDHVVNLILELLQEMRPV